MHGVSFVRISELCLASPKAQEAVKGILALQGNPTGSAAVTQEQAASAVRAPRGWQEVGLLGWFLLHDQFYYLYYFNSFLLGSPAFPCKTSSEIPLLELIMLPWQLEFSKFISSLLPSMNSLFLFPPLATYMFCARNKTWKTLRPNHRQVNFSYTLFQHSMFLLGTWNCHCSHYTQLIFLGSQIPMIFGSKALGNSH